MNAIACRLWTMIATCLLFSISAVGQSSNCLRPGDEVWLISARDFGSCCDANNFHCQRYSAGNWYDTSCAELFAANDAQPVCSPVVYVHGYQTDLGDAKLRGVQVYDRLFRSCENTQPIRYIIWAWKSERESLRFVQEFQEKASKANRLGDAFAMTLNRLQSSPPTVIAYSLGAQISISALVKSDVYTGQPVQLAVIAAATDCGFPGDCSQMRQSGNISTSYVFVNRGDVAIRAARLGCRIANGRKQIKFERIAPRYPAQLGHVKIIDVTARAKRNHSVLCYTSLPIVVSCINELIAIGCSRATNQPAASNQIGKAIEDSSSIQMAELNCSSDICVMR